MQEKLRYVTIRRNSDGSVRYYYQRPGRRATRLPDDLVARIIRWRELEAEAATARPRGQTSPAHLQPGTLAAAIRRYQASERYRSLAASSRTDYDYGLRALERALGSVPLTAITRRISHRYIESIASVSGKRRARSLLLAILDQARNEGEIDGDNPMNGYRLPSPGRSTRVATPAELNALRRACPRHRRGPALGVALELMLFTGQRPSDVVAMRTQDLDDGVLSVIQQKTGKRLRIPCHRKLRAVLDEMVFQPRNGVARLHGHLVADAHGRPLSRRLLTRDFRELCGLAGVRGLQARDLRRTAAVSLAEAGCTVPQIAAITGHEISTAQKILEHYLPPDVSVATEAIRRLEETQSGST